MKPRTSLLKTLALVSALALLSLAAAQPVEITFWHTYNEESTESSTLNDVLIPLFEADHPGITVEAVSVPYDTFRTKLLAAIAAGSPPDLIRSDIIWVPELADLGALVALDEVMPDFDELKDIVFEGPLSTNVWNGHYYGLPLDTNTKIWLYNPALYAEAGLSGPPATMADVADACTAFKVTSPDTYLFAADGLFAWVTLPWVWGFGGAVTDADLTTATGYLNGPETVAAYAFLLDLYDDGCIAPVIMGDGVDVFTGFASGLYASLDNGPWSYPILNGQFPDFEFNAAGFPAGDGGSVNVVGGENINVMSQSKHRDEALEFVRFVLSPDFQVTMLGVGQMPVRTDLADTDAVLDHPFLGAFLEQIATSSARTAHPRWSQMDSIITDAGQYIFRKEKTPQQALDDAAHLIDALLSR